MLPCDSPRGRDPRAKMASRMTAVLLWLAGSVLGLRDVHLTVPEAVGVGASATLSCRWALDTGETLYTVKWYHGAQEFFRFVPKELPNTKVFSQTGINVDVSRSGAQQVVLGAATHSLSGRYRCEVSADAPFFHTVYKTAYLRVVDLPDSAPSLHSQKSWYSVGDMLRANCSAAPANPPANLTWLLNGREVKGLDIPSPEPIYFTRKKPSVTDASLEDANRIIFSPWDTSGSEGAVTDVIDIPGNGDVFSVPDSNGSRKNKDEGRGAAFPDQLANKFNISTDEEKSNKSSSFSQLTVRVQAAHFNKGRLNMTCVAHVYSVWSASSFLLLDEERPQIAPVMGSRDSNSGFHNTRSKIGIALLLNFVLYVHWLSR